MKTSLLKEVEREERLSTLRGFLRWPPRWTHRQPADGAPLKKLAPMAPRWVTLLMLLVPPAIAGESSSLTSLVVNDPIMERQIIVFSVQVLHFPSAKFIFTLNASLRQMNWMSEY